MQFTVVRHNGRPYIEWKIGEPIPLNGTHENREYPYVIAAVISPADARVFAQSLLATADDADGGELRLAGMMQPPIPPPPPPPKSAK